MMGGVTGGRGMNVWGSGWVVLMDGWGRDWMSGVQDRREGLRMAGI